MEMKKNNDNAIIKAYKLAIKVLEKQLYMDSEKFIEINGREIISRIHNNRN